jgi:hypothetical protein
MLFPILVGHVVPRLPLLSVKGLDRPLVPRWIHTVLAEWRPAAPSYSRTLVRNQGLQL